MGLGLIGVINQAPCQYQTEHLQRKEFNNSGYGYGLVSETVDEGVPDRTACSRVDCDNHCFIATR